MQLHQVHAADALQPRSHPIVHLLDVTLLAVTRKASALSC